MNRLAARLGVTEGQAYTLVLGVVFGLVTAAIGIPPTLRDRVLPAEAAAPGTTGTTIAAGTPTSIPPTAGALPPPGPALLPVRLPSPASAPLSAAPETSSSPPSAGFADGGRVGDVVRLAEVGAPGGPSGIAVDATTGAFVVVTDRPGTAGTSKVIAYSATGDAETVTDVRQTTPRTRGLSGIAVDTDGTRFVLDVPGARVLRIDAVTGAVAVLGVVPDLGPCTLDPAARCELGLVDAAPSPQALAVRPDGILLVADAGQGIVWRVDRFGGATVWAKAPELVGIDGSGPGGVAVEADGSVIVTVGASLLAPTGAVFRIPGGDEHAAGGPVLLHGSGPGERPSGVAIGDDGRVFVALAGAGRIAVLDHDGTLAATVGGGGLVEPTGVAVRGRSLLVTDHTADAVFRLPVA